MPELAVPGVLSTGRYGVVLLKSGPGVVRMVMAEPLMLGKYQKLRVQTVLVGNAASVCFTEAAGPPAPFPMTCRLPVPEWAMVVLRTLLVWLPEVVHSAPNGDSKPLFCRRFGPTSATELVTSTRSSM